MKTQKTAYDVLMEQLLNQEEEILEIVESQQKAIASLQQSVITLQKLAIKDLESRE